MTSKRQEEKWVAGGEKGNEGRWGGAGHQVEGAVKQLWEWMKNAKHSREGTKKLVRAMRK